MSKIENFIRNNKAAFDAEEPSAGHMERFEQMLPKSKVRTLSYVRYAAAAAMIALMMTITEPMASPRTIWVVSWATMSCDKQEKTIFSSLSTVQGK